MTDFQALRSSRFPGGNVSCGPGGAERSKERRPAVQPSAWGLETFSVLQAVPFLSPFFSVPFSLASSPSSSKIQIGIVESLVDHLVLRLCFLGVTGFFTGRTGAGCFETVWRAISGCFLHLSTGVWNVTQKLHVSFLVADSFPNYVLLRLILK